MDLRGFFFSLLFSLFKEKIWRLMMKTKITGEMKWKKWEIIWNWMGDKMMGNEMKWREMMGWYEKCPEITKSVWGFLLIPRSEKAGDDLGSTRSERKSVEKSDLTLSVDFGQCKVAIFTFERMSQDAEIYLREDGRCSPGHYVQLLTYGRRWSGWWRRGRRLPQ